MIEIGRLRLQLPGAFQLRAARIGRLVGEALAREAPARDVQVDLVRVPPFAVDPALSDRMVAARIALAVRAQLDRHGS